MTAARTFNVKASRGGKPLRVRLQDIPELDSEQQRAAHVMHKAQRMLLLSDPGAGKTLTALLALALVKQEADNTGAERPRALIVCPPVAVNTWVNWTASMHHARGWACKIEVLARGDSPVTAGTDVLIIPHSLLSRVNDGLMQRVLGWGYDVFINDESDGMNGWTSNRTVAAYGPKFDSGLAGAAKWRWPMTGTALPRYNDGLFPVLHNLFPDRLAARYVKSSQNFLDTFTTQETVKYGKMRIPKKQVSGSKNNALLNKILFDDSDGFPCAIRNKLVLDAKLTIRDVPLDFALSDELSNLEEELATVEYTDARAVDPRMATALRMLGVETARHIGERLVADMDDKRDAGDRHGMLILYWHTEAGQIVADKLERSGYHVKMMNGSTTSDEDAETERQFNAGDIDFVVGQIKAMGVAINLQENCNDVRFIEDSFSDAANQQAYQRVYRRGQKSDVSVTFYRAERSTLADMKPRVTDRKRKGAKEVLDGHL